VIDILDVMLWVAVVLLTIGAWFRTNSPGARALLLRAVGAVIALQALPYLLPLFNQLAAVPPQGILGELSHLFFAALPFLLPIILLAYLPITLARWFYAAAAFNAGEEENAIAPTKQRSSQPKEQLKAGGPALFSVPSFDQTKDEPKAQPSYQAKE
jgi:hypothetical protein